MESNAMINSLLGQLRAKVENAHGLADSTKSELLELIKSLESHTTSTTSQHGVQLTTMVKTLEVSHPEITDLANRIATMLGNVGI